MVRGELTIQVSKGELLAALKENREKHAAAFEKAKAGYIKVMRQSLEKHLQDLRRGEMIHRIISDAPPDDHTADYDDVISMMEWAKGGEVELTQQQFKQYVKDDWGWKDSWVTSNTAYLEA